ncbi:MAG: hypothetical protein KA375_06375 [Vitreoscilla sp.]|nr:hypothetical protein [Burkholderiales bacterium]MBP6337202.1 hypothetical protein [Vitreoscilla sp.]MBP6675411.1 hypothetical protein [Vitreoscilla sp.]
MNQPLPLLRQAGLLLLGCGILFAGKLGEAWPYVVATGVAMVALHTAAMVWRLLR